MFKTSVVCGAVIFSCVHFATACSSVVSQSSAAPSESSRQAIVRELVATSSAYLPDRTAFLYIHLKTGEDWLRDALIDEFTAKQYLLSRELVADHHLSVLATRLGTDALHVSLKIDKHETVERVFQFEPTIAPERRNSLLDLRARRTLVESSSSESELPVHESIAERLSEPVHVVKSDVLQFAQPEVSNVEVSSDFDACPHLKLQRGSLKQNFNRILQACGWQLVSWPADPRTPGHELDWLIPDTQSLTLDSLEALIEALRTSFKLDIVLDRTFKSVRVQLRS